MVKETKGFTCIWEMYLYKIWTYNYNVLLIKPMYSRKLGNCSEIVPHNMMELGSSYLLP